MIVYCARNSLRIRRRHHKSLNHLAIRPWTSKDERKIAPCSPFPAPSVYCQTKYEIEKKRTRGGWENLSGNKGKKDSAPLVVA